MHAIKRVKGNSHKGYSSSNGGMYLALNKYSLLISFRVLNSANFSTNGFANPATSLPLATEAPTKVLQNYIFALKSRST